MTKIITRKRKYKGRAVRVIACQYFVTDAMLGKRAVDGYAVDAGQIPRIAVRQVEPTGWWQSEDWETGRSITLYGADIDDAIRRGLDKLAQMGEAKYRAAVAASVWPAGVQL